MTCTFLEAMWKTGRRFCSTAPSNNCRLYFMRSIRGSWTRRSCILVLCDCFGFFPTEEFLLTCCLLRNWIRLADLVFWGRTRIAMFKICTWCRFRICMPRKLECLVPEWKKMQRVFPDEDIIPLTSNSSKVGHGMRAIPAFKAAIRTSSSNAISVSLTWK